MQNQSQIVSIIESAYLRFFGCTLIDEFDEELLDEVKEKLQDTPQDYEAIILGKLGATKKYKNFVEELKKLQELKRIVGLSQLKPIHSVVLEKVELGSHTNLIYVLPLNHHSEWNLQNIIVEIDQAEREMIKGLIEKSSNLVEFFLAIEDYFLDFSIRRLDVSEIVACINRVALETVGVQPQLKQTLTELTCADFVRIFARFFKQKAYFGLILHRLAVPLPFLFTSKTSEGEVELLQTELLESVMRQNDYCLITNIGSTRMIGKGKTAFLEKMFLLDHKFTSNSVSNLHQGSVDFYSKVPHTLGNRRILIADFHSDYMRAAPHYKQLLKKCVLHSTAIFIHAHQREIADGENSAFVKDYQGELGDILGRTKADILVVLRDCKKSDDEALIEKILSFSCIRLPNLTDEQKKASISSKCSKLYKYLASLDDPHRPKLDSSVFLSYQALASFQHSKKQVESIMNTLFRLFQSKNFYARMFPNLELQLQRLALKQKAVRCKNEINRQIEQHKIFDQYNQINKQLNRIEAEKPKAFSALVTETLELLHDRFGMTYLLSDSLTAWRARETDTFIKSIIAMNAQYDNMKRNEGNQAIQAEEKEVMRQAIKRAEVQLETYDISVDTIFSEVIAALQKEEGEKRQGESQLIKRYYRQAYESITPINLIEGKTLEFGNPFLQEFIEQLSSFKYSYREVYVVSVVGAQSSAKSTILNYIFRCNFATSVGRCTKGVYLTIVECGDKVVVVVDTEGLLSVAARDHTFDVQIACFVMLVSDLVIINNKGEVDSVLRDLLGVCVYAIHELNSTQNNANYHPNSVIFTIRDQVEYGGTKQKQMLSQIIKSLNENSKVRYSDYINFTDKDIYPLQSAFVSQNEGIFCLQGANNSFGKSVLSLRSRILASLKTPKNRSLMQFYANSKRRWQAIQNCGENIFNFKSIYEIKTKDCIKQILETMKKEHVRKINNNQQEIVSCFHGKEVSRQADIEQELKMNYYKYKQNMLEEFHHNCQQRVNEQDYISDFDFEIEEFCTICYKDFIAKFRKRVLDIRFKEETTGFKKSIRDTLKLAYTSGKKDKEILRELEEQAARLEKDMKIQIQKLEERRNSMGQNELSLHISSHVEAFLRAFYLQSKISYLNLETLKNQHKKMQLLKSRRSKQLLEMFKCGGEILMDDKHQNVVKEIRGVIIGFLNEAESSVNALIKFEFNADIEAINPLMLKIMEELNQVYEIFMQGMQKYILKGQAPKFGPQHRAVILARIISTFPLKFEKTYYEMSRVNLQKKFHERQQAVLQLTAQVQESLKIRGNMLETARLWIKKILNRQLARYFEFSQQIIQRELEQICNVLNPRDIIKIGLEQSFKTSGIRSKERWFNCYKLIKNINRYLKEILFEQPDYRDLDKKLLNARRDATAKINKFIREKMVEEIESSARGKMEGSTCEGSNDVKNVDYYERLFGIDLATYKNDESEQRLEEILISMWGCVEEMKKDPSKVTEYCHFAELQLDQQALRLRNEVNQFIKEKIEPIVVGCQAKCPGCGMKCFKTGGHIDGHSLLKNSHIMQCFAGRVYAEDQLRSCDMCFTEQNIFEKYMQLQGGRRVPLIEWIQEKHPDWHDHFMDSKIYEKKARSKECNLIWANIEYVIIRYKYPYMRPDKNVWKLKYEELDDDDILLNHLDNY